MDKSWVQVKVRKSDKEKMMNECVEEFLRHHPELEGYHITQAHMFKQLIEFYLKA